MLDLGRYLLGSLELLWLAAFAGLGATALRRRLVPDFSGAPSLLTTIVLAAALLIWSAEALGTFGLFEALPYLALVGALGVSSWWLLRQDPPAGAATSRL